MKHYKFHTNIKCSNCEVKVAKILSDEPGIVSFDVDLESKNRTLKVEAIDAIKEEDIISMVKVAGYKAEPIKGLLGFLK
jgi:copper chaperone CopZ